MRNIKFRAYDKKYKCIVEVIEISFETSSVLIEYIDEHDKDIIQEYRSFEDIELMQYTGLKDKNGVEIYNGDLVTLPYYSSKGMTFKVVYNNERASYKCVNIKDDTTSRFFNCGGSSYKVIGNIYENKELLND